MGAARSTRPLMLTERPAVKVGPVTWYSVFGVTVEQLLRKPA
jgi:hypothetical protein